MALPERRPSDFTLGLVVFGTDDAPVGRRSARYIIGPDGTFRSSFGAGSRELTFPPITRRLDPATLDRIWGDVRALDPGGDAWRAVAAPEQFHVGMGSGQGYLLEIRSGVEFRAWSTGADYERASSLARALAALAWVQR